MFSLDPVKLLLVMVVALAVLGPDKLPHAARRISSLLADVRRWRESMEGQARKVVDDLPFADDLREAGQALHRVRSVANPRRALYDAVDLGNPRDGPLEHGEGAAPLRPPEPHTARNRSPVPVPGDPTLN